MKYVKITRDSYVIVNPTDTFSGMWILNSTQTFRQSELVVKVIVVFHTVLKCTIIMKTHFIHLYRYHLC